MLKIDASEFSRRFETIRDKVETETIVVVSDQKIAGYFVSETDYQDFMETRQFEKRALAAEELSEDILSSIMNARMDERHSHLDALLDD